MARFCSSSPPGLSATVVRSEDVLLPGLDKSSSRHPMTVGPFGSTAGILAVEVLARHRWTCLLTERVRAGSPLLLDKAVECMVLFTHKKSWEPELMSAMFCLHSGNLIPGSKCSF